MQRLHCWLDQLTLRRGRNRDADVSRRIISQSVTPSRRVTLESKNKHKFKPIKTSSQPSPPSRKFHEPKDNMLSVPVIPANAPMMVRKPETGSFARRRGIRTNPWLYGGDSVLQNSAYHPAGSLPTQVQSLERRYAPPTLLGVKSLEESTCSSGYGSQDCSPDSSIHIPSWQTTDSTAFVDEPFDEGSLLEETSSFSTYDNVCDTNDDHIYHELESCFRAAERSYSSTPLSSLADSRSSSPLYARPESPVYAQPWTHYHLEHGHHIPNVLLLARRAPTTKALTVRNQSFRRVLPEIRYNEYARPFHSRPVKSSYLKRADSLDYSGSSSSFGYMENNYCETNERNPRMENRELDETEEEFLSELDAQIAELQLRSDELRSIVEKACQRRHAASWLRPPMECTFELSI
ncbi:hypothetical protein KIN20_010129 [Parelaphostrongylus tenuis]|uniref:Uncharacterized protein n=1 Tax=Parelaphostrongylus tenuis TaxID=148309 RepID=A0AAD5MSV0_PARTN|nr:hypothetical protein KIN20_010129 [Parelaphostrongylus tenuis]